MEDMNVNQENFLRLLVEESKKLNEKSLSLTRCLLLALMKFNSDGIQFRELKTILNISDGKLQSNLDYLQSLGYIKKIEIQLDQRKMHIFMLSEIGEAELNNIIGWINIFKELENIIDDK